METIPLIDLENLPDVETISENSEWIKIATKVRDGLGSVGFLYLINHKVPKNAIDKVFSLGQQFFDLPLDVKLKYKKDTSIAANATDNIDYFNGYTPIGGEVVHPTSKLELKEAFDWLHNLTEEGNYPVDIFPDFYSSFRELDSECKKLTRKLLQLMAISLKLEDVDYFVKNCRHFDDRKNYAGIYNVRVQRYPAVPEGEAVQPGTVRCGEHSDYGLITLLFQDDVGGLEAKTVDGEWIHVEPIPGSIVVNTGDLIEFWTGGIFPATPHRIVIPDIDDERRRKSRHSVVFFNGPDFKTIVKPMDLEKTPIEQERLAKTGRVYSKEEVDAADHMLGRCAKQYI